MALTETRPTTDGDPVAYGAGSAPDAGLVERIIGSGDHLSVGRTFILASLLFGAISAVGMLLSGVDSASGNDLLGGSAALVWSSSSVALVLTGVLPLLLGLGIYLVPLQVGSPSIAFPRAAALALWSWLIGVLIFAASVALDGGINGADQDAARLGNVAVGLMLVALSLAAVTVATTVVIHRPVGMGLGRVPLFSWSLLIAAPVWIVSLSAALGGVVVGQISQLSAPALGANHQAMIGWLWGAPAVYMLAIPVLGIAGDVAAKAAGRRISQYGVAQGLIAAYGLLSFGAWSQSDRSHQTIVFFGWVILAGLPVLALLGLLADTMRRSRPKISAAAISVPLSLLLVLGGVVVGALQVIDTIGKGELAGFEVSLLQAGQLLFLVGAAFTGAIGGLAFWSDKLWGESKDSIAVPALLATFLGGGLFGTAVALQGVLVASTPMGSALYGTLVAVSAGLLALGVLGGLVAALSAGSAGHSGPAQADETGLTLEWAAASPPVSASTPTIPEGGISSPYPLLDLRDGSDEERNR